MRFICSVLACFILITSSAQNNIDVLHYKFALELSDKNDTIYGKAEIKLRALVSTNEIKIDMVKLSNSGKGMKVDSVTGKSVRGDVAYPNSISIMVGRALSIGDTVIYTIYYHGIPADGLIISKNKYGHRTFFSDNWPNRAHNWIPCVDDPADKATVEFVVTAPSHYQVVSNGVQTEEINLSNEKKLTHWSEEVPLPTKVMVIGVADFAVNKSGEVNCCVPVYSWVYPEERDKGFYDYALAKDILEFYINYFGPYPYKKLANVQSKTIFGGMENASAIFYHENSIDGRRGEEGLYAHEIVHQWFGDMATEKSFPHLWLSEGFATYFTHFYYEKKYGEEIFASRMKDDRTAIIDFVRSANLPVVDSVSPTMQLLNTNSYQRGSWVLHMLRRQLGDSIFHKGIKEYYETYKGKNANTEDFRAVLEKTSGKKLDSFFRQWLYTPDIPKLNITWKYDSKTKNITIVVNQVQRSGAFQFPLDLEIQETGSSPGTITRNINKSSQSFSVPVKSKPVRIVADPQTSLLFEGTVTEEK